MCARQRTHFSCFAKKSKQKKASRIRRPFATLRARCVARPGRGARKLAALKHARPLIRPTLRYSPPHYGSGIQMPKTTRTRHGAFLQTRINKWTASPMVAITLCRRYAKGGPMTRIRSLRHREMSESNKTKLTGRIYPAIQTCVGNRYKIAVGYFAVAAYVLFDECKLHRFVDSSADWVTTGIFTTFVGHNALNYVVNSREQWRFERPGVLFPLWNECWMEFLSSSFLLGGIWGGLYWLKCLATTSSMTC